MKRLLIVFALFALLLFAVALPIMAQEVTPDAPPVVAADPDAPPVADVFNFWEWLTHNQVVALAAVFGVILVLRDRQNGATLKQTLEHADKRSVDAIEAATKIIPPQGQIVIDRALDVAENLAEQVVALLAFLRKVTDGKPNDDPPTPEQG